MPPFKIALATDLMSGQLVGGGGKGSKYPIRYHGVAMYPANSVNQNLNTWKVLDYF